ncbi:MAG: amidohydrolase family protein [Thermodesulfobacteriota bacterium]
MLDLLIKNGNVVDGAGTQAFPADVAVQGERIQAVGKIDRPARVELDAGGLVVAPGFIDVHSHCDWVLPQPDHPQVLAPFLEQGITTVVGGNCGFSPAPLHPGANVPELLDNISIFLAGRALEKRWGSMASFLDDLERQGVCLNLAQLEGHGVLRLSRLGRNYGPPSEADLADLERAVDESLAGGAFGLSLGLGYEPGLFTRTPELKRLAARVKAHGAVLAVHARALSRLSTAFGRNPFIGPHNLAALAECLSLAEETGVRLQISHLIFVGKRTWPTVDRALEMIDSAYRRGVDVGFDAYPQTAGNTTILAPYPDWFLKDAAANFRKPLALLRLRIEWFFGFWLNGFNLGNARLMWPDEPDLARYAGMFFPEIARDMGCAVDRAYIEVSRRTEGRALCLFYNYSGDEKDESALIKVLTHPLCLYMTDALATRRGLANPGTYGAFPRLIQMLGREPGPLALEKTIARMTGWSASRFGLADRGTITPGAYADVVVFDRDGLRDNTGPDDSRARPSGIRHVLVNGRQVVKDGTADPGVKAGRVLRRGPAF